MWDVDKDYFNHIPESRRSLLFYNGETVGMGLGSDSKQAFYGVSKEVTHLAYPPLYI